MKVRVSNIQRFSLHDGPGIRTTIFLKGCNLRCPWCANPENIEFGFTKFINENTKEEGYFGQDLDCMEIYNEIIKDKAYYENNNGGVTFSGGEPLIQIKELEPLLVRLKKEHINMCIETALHTSTELVKTAIKYIDEFIVDIKILNQKECEEVLNGDLELYYKNLVLLKENKKCVVFRIPLMNEYTLKKDNIERILELIKQFKAKKIEIFKIHNLAESKYKSIGKKMIKFSKVEDKDVEYLYNKIKEINDNVEIIKI